MNIIDGKKTANNLNAILKNHLYELKEKFSLIPCLAVILVGNNNASEIYVRNKESQAKEIGIKSKVIRIPIDVKENELITTIKECNENENIDGILVQLPLPTQIDPDKIIECISPNKDVDGFHPENIGLLALGRPKVIPCTPLGCFKLLTSVTNIEGKNIVVIGRSSIVGRPLSYLLTNENATVTLCHSKSKNIKDLCSNKDILIAAVGVPYMIKKEWVKTGAIVLDVGINLVKNEEGHSKLAGDVDYHDVLSKVSAITPVPGGVGPMTIHSLLENTIRLSILRRSINYKLN